MVASTWRVGASEGGEDWWHCGEYRIVHSITNVKCVEQHNAPASGSMGHTGMCRKYFRCDRLSKSKRLP